MSIGSLVMVEQFKNRFVILIKRFFFEIGFPCVKLKIKTLENKMSINDKKNLSSPFKLNLIITQIKQIQALFTCIYTV